MGQWRRCNNPEQVETVAVISPVFTDQDQVTQVEKRRSRSRAFVGTFTVVHR
jgi:hypothetical protein